ncbi:MAG: GntR family transcriptional regulator [Anaerolineae bacterium]|nr:GntR family transcriptional regulator [Anaerolineae bacterium]
MIPEKGSLPKYSQIANSLRGQISSGDYKENSQLPNEDELSNQFQASRGTVREAIRLLVGEGLLRREQGRGTFVNPLQGSSLFTLSSFYEEMLRQNRVLSTQLLTADVIQAEDEIALNLQIPLGEPVIHIARLRMADHMPVAYEIRYLAQSLCPTLLEENLAGDSIHMLLVHKFNIPLVKIHHIIEMRSLSSDESQLLQVDSKALLFSVDRLSFTNHNNNKIPAVWFQALYRQDIYQFRAESQLSF